jgi:hypothetical protein
MAGEVDEQLMLAMAEFAGHQLISPFWAAPKAERPKTNFERAAAPRIIS